MSKTDPVTENPNDQQSPGKPLGPDEVAPTGNNDLDDDGLGPVNEGEDKQGLARERPLNTADLAEMAYDQTSRSR